METQIWNGSKLSLPCREAFKQMMDQVRGIKLKPVIHWIPIILMDSILDCHILYVLILHTVKHCPISLVLNMPMNLTCGLCFDPMEGNGFRYVRSIGNGAVKGYT